MFTFTEGMLVIVNRVNPLRSKEKIYIDNYPKVGWVGKLTSHSDREPNEWIIEWNQTYKGNTLTYEDARGDLVREWMISPYILNFNEVSLTKFTRVIYVSGAFGDSKSNPLFNGNLGQIYGEIKIINHKFDNKILVEWIGCIDSIDSIGYYPYNHKKVVNSYSYKDLLPLNVLKTLPKKNIKQHIEEVCERLYGYHKENNDYPRRLFAEPLRSN